MLRIQTKTARLSRVRACMLLFCVLLFFASGQPGFAFQFGNSRAGRADVGNVRVRVVYSDDRSSGVRARVRLYAAGGGDLLSEGICNDAGMLDFNSVPVGVYHLMISGEGLEETDSGSFEVDSRKSTQSIFVTVRRKGEVGSASKSGGTSVSVSQLKIPPEAKSKFEEASKLMAKQDWAGAVGRLEQATAIYPSYVEAYNNLAAAHIHLGDRAQAREDLKKATSLDDHFAPAFVNLARLEESDHDYTSAESLLNKATAIDPSNLEDLTLLCRAQSLAEHYDAAIATAHRVHGMPHDGYAVVHYIAARALQHENRTAEAIAEFKIMLKEEPTGARADAVRKEVAALEARH